MALSWPEGIRSAGVPCGIKSEGLDLGLIASDVPIEWAGTFTTNAAAAASVRWSRSLLGSPVRALVVNSGNANACTGPPGDEAVRRTVIHAAAELGCAPEEVLVASTGPIGVALPIARVLSGISAARGALSADCSFFSQAILTTDTKVKLSERRAGGCSIVGVAKGAAMIAPNMATMLAFIATDAALPGDELQSALSSAVSRSFNRISVDSCESTNDSVFLLSTGAADPGDDFGSALEEVCADLAEQIVLDAEGGTKIIRIEVEGAADEAVAEEIARAIADSALWRAAAGGADPNWGRILSAAGAARRDLDLEAVRLSIGPATVFAAGCPVDEIDLAAKAMQADEIVVKCIVGPGPGIARFLTCDMTESYVTLNAGGMS